MAKARNSTPYDESEFWKENCLPLVNKLMMHCQCQEIPFFLCAGVKESGTATTYETVCSGSRDSTYVQKAVMPIEVGRILSQDRIARHLLVERGYVPVPPAASVDYEDFDDEIFGDLE
jgi:hypothetical protein